MALLLLRHEIIKQPNAYYIYLQYMYVICFLDLHTGYIRLSKPGRCQDIKTSCLFKVRQTGPPVTLCIYTYTALTCIEHYDRVQKDNCVYLHYLKAVMVRSDLCANFKMQMPFCLVGFFSAFLEGEVLIVRFCIVFFPFVFYFGTCMQFLENYFISLLEFTGVNNINKNHKKNNKIELLKKYLCFF